MSRVLAAVAAAAILAAQLVPAGEPSPALHQLAEWLTGSFSSAAQAAADPGFRDIRLHVVRIWPDRSDGIWLYVEQAAAESLDRVTETEAEAAPAPTVD